jgi:hypothetical protein
MKINNMHEEIKNRKTVEEIFNDFESLKGLWLLFNKDTEYYKFSGVVTAALLDYDDPDKHISILAIKTEDNWYTFKYTREDLTKMFNNCDAFIGENETDSFLLSK